MLVWLIHFCIVAVAMILVSYIVPGIKVKSFGTALIAALVLGLVNTTIGRIIMFLTGPLRWLTFGLLTLVINGLILKFTAEFVEDFEVKGWLDAILGALLISVTSSVMHAILL